MTRVMVVDDSALVRRIVSDILSTDPDLEVVATAAQAEFALAKLEREKPDVITLDLEMPGMGGLEAIRHIMATRPTPIVVLSSHAQRGAERTLQALDLGAVDFVLKPSAGLSGGVTDVAAELTGKVKSAAKAASSAARTATRTGAAAMEAPPVAQPASGAERAPYAAERAQYAAERAPYAAERAQYAAEIVAIGTSTGGPVALKTVLAMLPADLPVGVVVVQHMPAVFTRAFADRLDACCAVAVKEAEHGDLILPGRVLIAPGGWHMKVSRFGGEPRVLLDQNAAVNGHRPSVDVLVRSVAAEYGGSAVGVIMTGMGRDGADGLHGLRARGGHVIAQDRDTSVIYGMNREVIEGGDADEVAPVEQIAGRIVAALRAASRERRAG